MNNREGSKTLTVDMESSGKRLDQFLSEIEEVGSRASAERLIKDGRVLVNGGLKPKSHKVKINEKVTYSLIEPEPSEIIPSKIPFKILFEDDNLAVISKPAGIVVHPSAGHMDDTLVHGLVERFGALSVIGDKQRPGIVHRLDKDTSGLMIIAKNDKSHRKLSEALKDREIKRSYLALVTGKLSGRGVIEAPVGRHPVNRKKMAVTPGGRYAVTNYEAVEQFDKFTLLEVSLGTGRTHQIRVHMLYIKHPVAGDPVYGGETKETQKIGLKRQFLHSFRLEFYHPINNSRIYLEEELPPDLLTTLKVLRGEKP